MTDTMQVNKEAFITSFVRQNKEQIRRILEDPGLHITEKTTYLRRLARTTADVYAGRMDFRDLEDFEQQYDLGNTPLTYLEGPGFRVGDLFVLKHCPIAPLFSEFKENGSFPEYWDRVSDEFMRQYGKEAILHPLCIVHQTFRDQLTSRLRKGEHFVHSVTVACRSGATGKILHSSYGIGVAKLPEQEVDAALERHACAFFAI